MSIHEQEMLAPATMAPPLWRNRDYLLLWGGQAVSQVGDAASQLAFPLLILALTDSPAQAGFISAVRAVAYVLLGLPAGALIDRWDRKRVMIICDAGRALALGSIPLALVFQRLTMAQLYLVALVEGALYVFFGLAQSAALPHVVAKTQLPAATAQDEVTGGVVTLIGPSLGGALFGVTRALPFLADAVSYAASVISLSWIRLPFQEARPPQHRELRGAMWDGLLWIWREPVMRALAALHGGLVFAYGGGITLVVLVSAQRLSATPFAIGLMFGVSGLGAILGALLGSQVHKRFRLWPIMVGVFWLFPLLWPLFAIAPTVLALGVILAAFWVVDEVYDVAQLSYRYALIPDALRGRVNGALRIIFYGCEAVSVALTGLLLQRIGVGATIFCFEVALLALALAATLNRDLRTARPLAEL
jgi:predicted MFS family arabinose efflux permease